MSNMQENKVNCPWRKRAGRGTGKQTDATEESLEVPGLHRTQFQVHSFHPPQEEERQPIQINCRKHVIYVALSVSVVVLLSLFIQLMCLLKHQNKTGSAKLWIGRILKIIKQNSSHFIFSPIQIPKQSKQTNNKTSLKRTNLD